MNILFRADSSATIGTGHIMRDLVLAKQFSQDTVIFATQDLQGNINSFITQQHYRLEILQSNQLDELIQLIKTHSIDMIVIDHYGINIKDEQQLKQQTHITVFVLDDTYQPHHCDILLNHNIYADPLKYQNLVPASCELRCGQQFILLREEFHQAKNAPSPHQSHILIAMGGADNAHLNRPIIHILQAISTHPICLVTTTANPHLDALKKDILHKNHICLHINSTHMAQLMSEAIFAIVTPSVTINEIIIMQIPFIAIKTASNQREMYRYLVKHHYLTLAQFNAEQLKQQIQLLIKKHG